jgi:hypothetical protein
MALFRKPIFLTALLAAGLVTVAPGRLRADNEPPQLTQDTQDIINEEVRPESEAKQWDKVLVSLDKILAKVPADSYDAALMAKLQFQAYLNLPKPDFPNALAALERAVAIGDRHNYFSAKESQENLLYIAKLAYQEGATSKDPKVQAAMYAKTLTAMERWLQNADQRTLTQDDIQFVASVYFTLGQGIEVNGEQKTDVPMMEKAMKWIDRGLRSAATPRDVFYQLKISGLFQLNRLQDGYEYLELRLHDKPDNKGYWQQLAFTYMQLANQATEKHDDQSAFTYNVRAILTLERAQKLGFLNSQKDNYNLVTLYFTIGQYYRACELLDAGLKDGGIESTRQNWELLAYSYQQQHQDLRAVQTLEEATKQFPQSGQLEYQIAQIYSGIDRERDALAHIKLCVAKGGTEKPQVGWLFYSWLAYDLKDFDDAMKAAQQAAKYPEAAKEAARMIDAIKASITDRDNRIKAGQAAK